MLRANMGKGYFAYDLFTRAPPVYTDAPRSREYTGGGWVSADGEYLWFVYGTTAAKSPIDRLEGDTVVSAVETLAHKWHKKIVMIHIDNSAFQLSAVKGWSRADRLNDLLKDLYFLFVRHL